MRFVLAVCVLALAACSPGPAAPETSAAAPATSTASTPDLLRAVDAKVKAALLPPGTFDDVFAEFLADQPKLTDELGNTDGKLSAVCLGARVDSGVSTSRKRVWKSSVIQEQTVFGLVGTTGVRTLDTVRAKARSCQTYVAETNMPSRVVKADVLLLELQGADDQYAFCESQPDLAALAWSCEAFLVRGDLIVKVRAQAHEELARAVLLDMAVRAEKSLVAAA